ncbi:MAG: hypothetical protein KDA64_12475 [Rhodospirillaceae bacterium]|nr:hypothetical protein [Rhodospirillaceae bacterium]
MSVLDRANKVALSGDDMVEALGVVNDLPPEDRRSMQARTVRLLQHFEGTGRPGFYNAGEVVMAIEFRFWALAKLHLTEHRGLAGWILPTGDRFDYVKDELLSVAATEPLVEIDGRVAFDAESFIDHLLAISEEHGRA